MYSVTPQEESEPKGRWHSCQNVNWPAGALRKSFDVGRILSILATKHCRILKCNINGQRFKLDTFDEGPQTQTSNANHKQICIINNSSDIKVRDSKG